MGFGDNLNKTMGLLGNLVKGSIDGVVIELDKGTVPYVAGEKVSFKYKLSDFKIWWVGNRICAYYNTKRWHQGCQNHFGGFWNFEYKCNVHKQ